MRCRNGEPSMPMTRTSRLLVMHGSADRILPIDACGPRTHELVATSEYVVIENAPHGLCWTHADEVNAELLRFFE